MMKLNRREFLKAIGLGSTATAAACSADPVSWDPMVPIENIYPYVVQSEQIIPGTPTFVATTCNQCSERCGLLARFREGRVINLEGNQAHPLSKGKICFRGQTGLQETYSPDRITKAMKGNTEVSWEDAIKEVASVSTGRVAWIGRPRTGASHAIVKNFVQEQLNGKILYWDENSQESLWKAVQDIFRMDAIPSYHLAEAHTIVNFGLDFLNAEGSLEFAKGWADSRDPEKGGFVSKMFSVGPRIGLSNANTDIHISTKAGGEAHIALAAAVKLAAKNGYDGAAKELLSGLNADTLITESGAKASVVDQLVDAMSSGLSVVLPGGAETSANSYDLAVATLLLNEVAGNIGKSVTIDEYFTNQNRASAKDILDTLGNVDTVFIDNLDLVYAFSDGAKVAEKLQNKKVVLFTNEPNDMFAPNTLVIPVGTSLEKWGDSINKVGLFSIQQATMKPANGHTFQTAEDILLQVAKGKQWSAPVAEVAPAEEATESTEQVQTESTGSEETAQPVLSAVALPSWDAPDFYTYVKTWWESVVYPAYKADGGAKLFREFWIEVLQNGFYQSKVEAPAISWNLTQLTAPKLPTLSGAGDFDLVLFPHPYAGFGAHANRPWAREVPDPLSGFSWDTWIEIHPTKAEALGLSKDKGVKLTINGQTIDVGWFGSPGLHENTIAVVMGGGKANSGRYAGFGKNPLKLIEHKLDPVSGALSYITTKATVAKSDERNAPNPQNGLIKSDTLTKNGRNVNFTSSIKDFTDKSKTGKGSIVPEHHLPATSMAMRARETENRFYKEGTSGNTPTLTDMYPEPEHPTYRFAMALDLNRCTGCNACNAACYAENNIPVVGPEQVRMSRSMGWIRLSRYWEGKAETPEIPDIRFQPVMCQQCSHAPCEGVCPVLATYHNLDGINAMIYNRCVGTRYCANNCPYSARRFNFHTFRWPESFNLMLNPNVVAREMGIMEKCTFCIQRIRDFKDTWRDENGFAGQGSCSTNDADYARITACAAACPADAITFGNLKVADSAVAKKFEDRRAYRMLDELNTKPGVAYLTRIVHTESAMHHGGHGSGHGNGHGGHHDDKGHGDAGHGHDHQKTETTHNEAH